jgi:hypothetical protein
LLNTFNLKWAINSPTRVTKYSATAIDNVVTNLASRIKIDVLNSAISDHFAQSVIIENCNPITCPPISTMQRSTTEYNIGLLNEYLTNETWDSLELYPTTNLKYEYFINKFKDYIDLACPYKIYRRKNKKVLSGWITKGIRVSRKNIKLYNKMLPYSQSQNFLHFYKRYKTIYRRTIKAAKSLHINQQLRGSKCVSKSAWSMVNRMKNNIHTSVIEIEKEGVLITEPEVVANEFNTYFSNVANNVAIEDRSFDNSIKSSILMSMFLEPVTQMEMFDVFLKLPPKKSTDIDGISQWLLKQCFVYVVKPLTLIINQSFQEGVFPELCKQAKIVPIYKQGSMSYMGNYRPISLLPILGKVFEKLYYKRLVSFLDRNNIISYTQYGFRKGRCTSDAINSFLEYIVKSLDNQMKTSSIFLDLSKAFDCVHHKSLLQILNNLGVRGLSLKWIESYLSNRKQVVLINNKFSNSLQLKYGVPQGSILGPILFNIYVNNCKSNINNSVSIIQYADDTTLSFSCQTVQDLELLGHENLNACVQYFENLNLKTNLDKTKCMHFKLNSSVNNFNNTPSVFIGDTIINDVDCAKFLGLHIDKALTWDSQIDNVCKKISSGVFLLRQMKEICSIEALKVVYYGVIQTHLSYGVIFWGSCSETKLLRAFVLQKLAIRVICRLSSRQSCKDHFKNLNILTLPALYIFETIIFCVLKCNLVQGRNVHSYNTRSNTIFRQDSHRLLKYEKLPMQAGIKFLNIIPDNIKAVLPDLNVFKNKLKMFLLNMVPYSVAEFINDTPSIS